VYKQDGCEAYCLEGGKMFIIPPFMLRKKTIVSRLRAAGATSAATAKTLEEAGVFYPNSFRRLTENMVAEGVIKTEGNDRYYI
jgi:hypothetical protein